MARRHKRNSRHAARTGQAATIRALEDLDRVERRRAAEAARRLELPSLAGGGRPDKAIAVREASY